MERGMWKSGSLKKFNQLDDDFYNFIKQHPSLGKLNLNTHFNDQISIDTDALAMVSNRLTEIDLSYTERSDEDAVDFIKSVSH